VGPVEELLTEKIVVELMRYNRSLAPEQDPRTARIDYLMCFTKTTTRYHTAVNRQLFQAIRELERIQSKRKAEQKEAAKSEEESD
jgi:hypothetical protein